MKYNTIFSLQLDHDDDSEKIKKALINFLQLYGSNINIRNYTSENVDQD